MSASTTHTSDETALSNECAPACGHFQFRLRSLFILVTVVAIVLAICPKDRYESFCIMLGIGAAPQLALTCKACRCFRSATEHQHFADIPGSREAFIVCLLSGLILPIICLLSVVGLMQGRNAPIAVISIAGQLLLAPAMILLARFKLPRQAGDALMLLHGYNFAFTLLGGLMVLGLFVVNLC